jgi:hypothetical protein
MIDAKTTLLVLGEPGAFGGQPPLWNEAMDAMPPILPFLDPATLKARREAAGLPPERDRLLAAMVSAIAADRALSALAWYLHWRVFVAPHHGVPWGAPPLLNRFGDQAGIFYLLLGLEFVPALKESHRRRGYPQEVTAQTLFQLIAFERNHLRGRGLPGLYENQLPWLAVYLMDPYVRLGRFEYQLHPYGGGVQVWRRASDGQILALAEQGARVDDEGNLLPAGAAADEGWTAHLTESETAVTGFAVDPAGRILKKSVCLRKSEWSCCLRKTDTVLDLHIPSGGGMDWERMTDSFRQALDFFARYHPAQPFAALVCGTWFLDPQLAGLVPPDANPLRLQRAVHLYPINGGPGGLWFVFQRDIATTAPADLPQDTSLRRALAGFLAAGGKWRGGGMFILKEDMAHPRENLYRDRFRALLPQL